MERNASCHLAHGARLHLGQKSDHALRQELHGSRRAAGIDKSALVAVELNPNGDGVPVVQPLAAHANDPWHLALTLGIELVVELMI